MPTYQALPAFRRDYKKLTGAQAAAWEKALRLFIACLQAGEPFSTALRVKRVQGFSDVWEMTWAADGRATFHYGEPVHPGHRHIIWRRIGTHAIFRQP